MAHPRPSDTRRYRPHSRGARSPSPRVDHAISYAETSCNVRGLHCYNYGGDKQTYHQRFSPGGRAAGERQAGDRAKGICGPTPGREPGWPRGSQSNRHHHDPCLSRDPILAVHPMIHRAIPVYTRPRSRHRRPGNGGQGEQLQRNGNGPAAASGPSHPMDGHIARPEQ